MGACVSSPADSRPPPPPIQADSERERGNEAYREGRYSEAIFHYTRALPLAPNDGKLYSNRAAAYLAKREWHKALADAEEATRLLPSWPKAWGRRAQALWGLRRYREVMYVCACGLWYDPTNPTLTELLNKAKLKLERQDTPKSPKTPEPEPERSWSSPEPESAATRAEKLKAEGNKALEAGQFQVAIDYYSEAIELLPADARLYSNRAVAYMKKEDWAAAIVDADSAIALNPRWSKPWGRRAQGMVGLGRHDEARVAWKQGLLLEPTNAFLLAGLKATEAELARKPAPRRDEGSMLNIISYDDVAKGKQLGKGSFGCVYEGRYNGVPVALKELIRPTENDVEALKNECRLLSSLRHPNIIEFMGVSLPPDKPAMMTELCARGSISHLYDKSPQELTWPRRMQLMYDTAVGMLHLHSQDPPVLHRDMKSPNVVVSTDWRAKICDVGLSKELFATMIGTMQNVNPRWLAPELMQTSARATMATDVYGYGLLVYELLALGMPWPDTNPHQVFAALFHGHLMHIPPADTLPNAGDIDPTALEMLVELVVSCIHLPPAERPKMEKVVEQIRGISQIAGISLCHLGSGPRGSVR